MFSELCNKPADLYKDRPVLRIYKKELLKAYIEGKKQCFDELYFIINMYCNSFCFDHLMSDEEFQSIINTLYNAPKKRDAYVEFRVDEVYEQTDDKIKYPTMRGHSILSIVIFTQVDNEAIIRRQAAKLGYQLRKLRGQDRYLMIGSDDSFTGIGYTLSLDDVSNIISEKARNS